MSSWAAWLTAFKPFPCHQRSGTCPEAQQSSSSRLGRDPSQLVTTVLLWWGSVSSPLPLLPSPPLLEITAAAHQAATSPVTWRPSSWQLWERLSSSCKDSLLCHGCCASCCFYLHPLCRCSQFGQGGTLLPKADLTTYTLALKQAFLRRLVDQRLYVGLVLPFLL